MIINSTTLVSRSAATGIPDPDAIEFVRFCYRRRRVGWPELYDEMCAVAGRGLFRGYDADDLAGLGIGFSLFDMPALSLLAARVVVEEQARHNDVRAIHLEIVRTNNNAKRLYSKTGFVDRNHYLMSKKIASEPA